MLNPFPRSYPTFDNLLADFLPNLTESSTMFAHFLLNFGKKVILARKSAKRQTFLSMLNSLTGTFRTFDNFLMDFLS